MTERDEPGAPLDLGVVGPPPPELPIELPAGRSTIVTLTWTVTDCDAAWRFDDVQVLYVVTTDTGAASGDHPLIGGRGRAELVLLTDRVCGQ